MGHGPKTGFRGRGLACLLALGLAACAAETPPILDCQSTEKSRLVCGLQSPEDLALLPGGDALLFGQFGSMDGSRAGTLAILDVASNEVSVVFSGGDAADATPVWGDPDCPGPPGASFTPHGIDVAPRPDGSLRLLVVNHGGRESVEIFEVRGRQVVWRGCAVPEEAVMNDVVALPDGGFLATRMFGSESQVWIFARILLGMDTGSVLEWQPGAGFRGVPGTRAAMPNGIEVSEDGTSLYLTAYMNDEVRRIARETGERLATIEIPRPDNLTWSPDGRLLVASQLGSTREALACGEIEQGTCPLAFEIVALDPETLEPETLLASEATGTGAGSVALQLGDELFIGTFSGDRIARVRTAP
jgi:hypothetical protein